MLIYIISLPKVQNEICEKLVLRAIKNGNSIIKFNYEKILKCKNEIFKIQEIVKILMN